MMDHLLYLLGRGLVGVLQALPLAFVARLGRVGGGVAYWLDRRHRRAAIENLTRCFGREKLPAEILAIARENFRRLGENYGCAIKTASMTWAELEKHLEFEGLEKLRQRHEAGSGPPEEANQHLENSPTLETPASLPRLQRSAPTGFVIAIGHFGNFELYARANKVLPQFQFATTYRALKQPGLNRLLVELRTRSGCLLFERRADSEALRAAMTSHRLILGFFSDQHAGTGGAWIPFFGQPCSTTIAPAVYALRYQAPLHTAICYRTGLARWRIEVGDQIPVQERGQRRTSSDIMLDVNRAFEVAIRGDPANWFWVHKRWKMNQSKVPGAKSKVEQPLEQVGSGK